jgi:serine/threonine protein kinase
MYNNVLSPNNLTGKGLMLQGECVICIHMPMRVRKNEFDNEPEPATEFEVIKQLGASSYAVVYQVKEVLSWWEYSNDGCIGGRMDGPDGEQMVESKEYRRQCAVKCLSKVNPNEEALEVQMVEVHCFSPLLCI